jgi:hypothetical protein
MSLRGGTTKQSHAILSGSASVRRASLAMTLCDKDTNELKILC